MTLVMVLSKILPGFAHASGHAGARQNCVYSMLLFSFTVMKKLLVLSLTIMVALPQLVWGQGRASSETITSAAQQVAEEIGLDRLAAATNTLRPADARNLSVLRQAGQSNQASIEQVSQGNSPNQALVVQAGNANITDFYQYGSGNDATLTLQGNGNTSTLNQRGTNNTFDGRVVGNRNEIGVVQDGQNNHATLDAAGDGRRYPVLQIGNNNQLTQHEAIGTTAPLGYGVEMRGNGIRLTIEQGRAQP